MNIETIENMTVEELKRPEVAESAKQLPVDQLASRYVQARLDAKVRDEKLADQGELIASLEAQLAERVNTIAANTVKIEQLEKKIAELGSEQ